MRSDTIASRGNHQPVWRYLRPDGSETRAGTTGIYTNPFGPLIAGTSNLGAVPDFDFFAVPGTDPAVKFDVFPGAPAVTGATVVFKGNFTEGLVGRTGVYYRDLTDAPITLLDGTDARTRRRHESRRCASPTPPRSSPAPRRRVRLHRPAQRGQAPGGVRRLRQRGESHQGRHLHGAADRAGPDAHHAGQDRRPGARREVGHQVQQARRGSLLRRALRRLLGRVGGRDQDAGPAVPRGGQRGTASPTAGRCIPTVSRRRSRSTRASSCTTPSAAPRRCRQDAHQLLRLRLLELLGPRPRRR